MSSGETFFDVFVKYLEKSPSTAAIAEYVNGLLATARADDGDEKRKGDFGEDDAEGENGSTLKKVKL
jgi:hypothetical protein